jgi:hypothetical protein
MPARVSFVTDSEATAEQFVREYLLGAIDRAPEMDGCAGLSFGLNEAPNPDRGSIVVGVLGDADAFLRAEQPRWEEYEQAGTLEGWDVQQLPPEQYKEIFGEQGVELTTRLMPLAERMATLVYEEFDSLENLPAAADTYPDEETDVGWWVVPHHIAYASLDYSAVEEIQMHKAGIEEDLKLIAEFEGEDAVDEHLDALLADLEEMRDEVKEGRTRFQTD